MKGMYHILIHEDLPETAEIAKLRGALERSRVRLKHYETALERAADILLLTPAVDPESREAGEAYDVACKALERARGRNRRAFFAWQEKAQVVVGVQLYCSETHRKVTEYRFDPSVARLLGVAK